MKSSHVGFLLLLLALPCFSQSRLPDFDPSLDFSKRSEFTFARMIYTSYGWRESWTTDYPKADHQFIAGLHGWVKSLLSINRQPISVSVHDPKIYETPFLYCVEPGQMEMNEQDAAALREYLLRGGFLLMDDFWGEREWQNVQAQLVKVFPDLPIKEIPLTHSIFHCYYDIDEVIQVPNVSNWIYRHQTSEKDGYVPHFDGISDKDGRLLVLIARNSDNGDAWEWIDEPRYSLKYGLAAYRLGMNSIVYSMTH